MKLAGATGTVIDRAGIFLAGPVFGFGFSLGADFALPILLVISVGELTRIHLLNNVTIRKSEKLKIIH